MCYLLWNSQAISEWKLFQRKSYTIFLAHAHNDRPTCWRSRENCGTQERLEARCTEFAHRPHISTFPFHFEYESAIARSKSLWTTREKTQATSPFVWKQNLLKCWYLCNTCLYHEFCCPTDSKAKTSDSRSTTLLSAPLCAGLTISLTHWLLSPPSLSLFILTATLPSRAFCVYDTEVSAVALKWFDGEWFRHKHKLINTSQNTAPLTPTSTEGSLVRAQPSRASEPCVVLKGTYMFTHGESRDHPPHL